MELVAERIAVLFAFGNAISLIIGVWWGHVITLRSVHEWYVREVKDK